MDSSYINLPPPPLSPPPQPQPSSPPHPHPGVSIAHVSPFPLLDFGETSAQRPCKHRKDGFLHGGGSVGDHLRPRFQCYSPGPIPYPSPSSSSPKPRPRQKPPDTPSSAAGNTSTPPCTECGKLFSSWKALFGHMRCHPERQWRGINPPPHLRRPPQLLLTSPSPPQPPLLDDSEEDDYEVASCLLLLSRGRPRTETSESRGGYCSHEAGSSSVPPLTATSGGKNARGWKRSWEKRSPVAKHRKRWKWAEDGGGKPNGSKRKLLDLNLPPPPPMGNNEGSSSSAILDLRLGI